MISSGLFLIIFRDSLRLINKFCRDIEITIFVMAWFIILGVISPLHNYIYYNEFRISPHFLGLIIAIISYFLYPKQTNRILVWIASIQAALLVYEFISGSILVPTINEKKIYLIVLVLGQFLRNLV